MAGRFDSKKADHFKRMFSVNPRALRRVFTVNNYSETEYNIIDQWLQSGVAKYAIIGKEIAPTTGTQHLQGYIHLEKKQYRRTIATAIKKKDGTCIWSYLQPAVGSELQNREYCSKSGDYKEYGALKKSTRRTM